MAASRSRMHRRPSKPRTRGGVVVRLWDGTWYAMSRDELTVASATLAGSTPIGRALKPDRTPLLFPDLPLDTTLHYFPRWPLLPVLNRADKSKLEGVITLEDVLRRYQDF